MVVPTNNAKPVREEDQRYTTCKGILAYAGKQRAKGEEPHCLGFKALLPPNIIITDEDVVPPPPEGAMFTFFGVGVSVYSKEMLEKNRLPLVNGFSRLTVLKEEEARGEKAPQHRQRRVVGANEDTNDRPHEHGQRQPRQHTAAEAPVADVARIGQQQGSAVPAPQPERRGGGAHGGGGEEKGEGSREQMEAFVTYAAERVKKQAEITQQVAEELTKLTPGKLREAAVVQANKVQQMPTLLRDTSRRMFESGTRLVQNYLDEQERKK